MSRLRRTTRQIGLLTTVVVGAALIGGPAAQSAARTTKKAKTTKGKANQAPASVKTVPVIEGPPCAPNGVTTVATGKNTKFKAAVNVYKDPAADSQLLYSVAVGLEYKGAVVFTVVKTEGDWVNVHVAARPNGVTGWVRKSDVTTYQHRYAIRVDLNARKMVICNAGRPVQIETVAVGSPDKGLTPTGDFFIADLVQPKNQNGPYGPFAYGLSGFSENPKLENWNGGDGRIAIHGTNQPQLLGTAASHGCIRVSNAGILKMRKILPLGVPVEIF